MFLVTPAISILLPEFHRTARDFRAWLEFELFTRFGSASTQQPRRRLNNTVSRESEQARAARRAAGQAGKGPFKNPSVRTRMKMF